MHGTTFQSGLTTALTPTTNYMQKRQPTPSNIFYDDNAMMKYGSKHLKKNLQDFNIMKGIKQNEDEKNILFPWEHRNKSVE